MDNDKQMEFLFEEGGIADDGMERDPVSGNEVPPGSLAEEVRDDIPAQLSEGEYVVPADVVRYYGVKYFEDLRREAKEGLGEMEEDGRIGGEPIDMEEYDDAELTPEEMAELESIMGMAMGGFVPQQTMQQPDPYQQQAMMYQQQQPRAFQEGGDTTQVDTSLSQFSPGFSFMGGYSEPVVENIRNVTLYGPNGEIVPLVLPAEQSRYDALLGQGYSLEQTPTVQQPSSEGVYFASSRGEATEEGRGGDSQTRLEGPETTEPRDLSGLSTEELQANLRGLDTMNKIGSGLLSVFNPFMGMATNAFINNSRSNIVSELESRGEDMTEYRRDNGRDLYGGGFNMYDGLQDINDDGKVNFGDTWLGDALGFDGRGGVQGPGLRDSRGGSRRDFTPTISRSSTTPTSTTRSTPSPTASSRNNTGGGGGGGGGEGGDSPRAPTSSPTPTPRPDRSSGGSGATRSGSAGDGTRGGGFDPDRDSVNSGGPGFR